MRRNNERGAALVITIILIAVLSVMTVSMMYLSQSEGWSTSNYRLMSAARDGAEAGLNRAANFLMGNTDTTTGQGAPQGGGAFTYTPPTAAGLAAFTSSGKTSPVQAGGSNVVLVSSNTTGAPTENYPTGAGVQANVATNFHTYVPGTLTLGSSTTGQIAVKYGAYAELLAIKNLGGSSLLCGGGGNNTLERWRVTGQGNVSGVQGAVEQVSAILDRPIASCSPVAAYATSNTCDNSNPPLSFNGGGFTDSYDSTTSGCSSGSIGTIPAGSAYGTVSGNSSCGLQATGGSVGTNGYINISTNTTIYGSVYEPRPGATGGGNCNPNHTGNGQVLGNPPYVQEAQVPNYPPPALPTPAPTSGNDVFQQPSDCTSHPLQCSRTQLGSATYLPGNAGNNSDKNFRLIATCTPAVQQCGSGNTAYQDLQVKGNGNIYHMCPGTYNVNSIAIGAGATLWIHQATEATYAQYCGATPAGPVFVNVLGAGHNSNQPVIDFSSGTLTNPSMSAGSFQLLYNGDMNSGDNLACTGTTGSATPPCGTINLTGGAGAAALVYAPNAAVSLSGNGTFYGAMVGYTVNTTGGGNIAYDRSLSSTAIQPGNPMMQAFTWKKF